MRMSCFRPKVSRAAFSRTDSGWRRRKGWVAAVTLHVLHPGFLCGRIQTVVVNSRLALKVVPQFIHSFLITNWQHVTLLCQKKNILLILQEYLKKYFLKSSLIPKVVHEKNGGASSWHQRQILHVHNHYPMVIWGNPVKTAQRVTLLF